MDVERRKRVDANWTLRRRLTKLHAEFDFLSRECVQLCEKRFVKPPVESIELTEIEEKFLKDLRERKLKEVVTKHCLSCIKFLMSHKALSYPFNEPVDTVTYRDYLNYVRTPMDFGTIKGKIHQYQTPSEFEEDVRLVFENAKKYNAPETDVRHMASMLESKFEERWSKTVLPKIEELKVSEVEDQIAFKQSKADNVTMEAETRVDECCRLLLNKLQGLSEEIKYVQCLAAAQCQPLTEHEQLRLGWELTTMSQERFQKAVNLVLMRHPGLIATMRDNTIDLDLNKVDCLTLRQLQDYVRHCNKEKEDDDDGPTAGSTERKRPRQPSLGNLRDEAGELDGACEVQWPAVPFGIGLKPYDPEVEPFVPPSTDDCASLQFSSAFANHPLSGPSTGHSTPPRSSPEKIKPEEALHPPASSSASVNQIPVFIPPPRYTSDKASISRGGEGLVSGEMMSPSSFSLLSLTHPERIQQTLTTPRDASLLSYSSPASASVSELRPPTVLVSSAGLAAIPLVPVSQPTNVFPSFFTANLHPSSSPALNPHTAFVLQPAIQASSRAVIHPYVCTLTSQTTPATHSTSTEALSSASLTLSRPKTRQESSKKRAHEDT